MNVIRGLTRHAIEAPLRAAGFSCGPYTGARAPDGQQIIHVDRICTNGGLVVMYGLAGRRRIRALSAGAPDSRAREFLREIAGLPYEGAEPGRARVWLDANVGTDGARVVIGGVELAIARPVEGMTALRLNPAQ